jgi:hypothetical protein
VSSIIRENDDRLIAFSNQEIKSVKINDCSIYKSCRKCILIQDPYCGWDLFKNKCVYIKNQIDKNIKQHLNNFVCNHDENEEEIKSEMFNYFYFLVLII